MRLNDAVWIYRGHHRQVQFQLTPVYSRRAGACALLTKTHQIFTFIQQDVFTPRIKHIRGLEMCRQSFRVQLSQLKAKKTDDLRHLKGYITTKRQVFPPRIINPSITVAGSTRCAGCKCLPTSCKYHPQVPSGYYYLHKVKVRDESNNISIIH